MHLGDRIRVDERRDADLDRAAARDEKLERIFGSHDPADPDDGDAHCPRGLVGEVHGQRADRRPGQAAGAKAEARSVRVDVDRHPDEGVYRAQGIGAGRLDSARDDADVADHRRELHPDRQLRALAHRLGYSRCGVRIVAEVESPLLDVRTRDVDLETGDAGHAIEPRGELAVFRGRLAVDVDQDREIPFRPPRRVIADKRFGAGPLQADRIEHPARRLGDARRRGSLPRTKKDTLRHHRAQRAPVQQGNLGAVAKRARRGQHGTAELHRPQGNRHVHGHIVTAYGRCDGSAGQSTSAAR